MHVRLSPYKKRGGKWKPLKQIRCPLPPISSFGDAQILRIARPPPDLRQVASKAQPKWEQSQKWLLAQSQVTLVDSECGLGYNLVRTPITDSWTCVLAIPHGLR